MAFLLIPTVGTRGLFAASLVPGTIALVVLLLFVRDGRGTEKRGRFLRNAKIVLTRRFLSFLAVIGVFGIGAYNFSFVLIKAGELGVDQATIPLVYATLNTATVLAGLPSGLLADRIGKKRVLILGFALFAAATLTGLLASGGVLFAYSMAFIFGLYLGTSETVQRAIIPSLANEELKGTAYALYYFLLGGCSFVANFVFGVLWDSVSVTAAFSYSMVTSIAGILCFGVLLSFWSRKPPDQYHRRSF